jgi:hypothetical protein
MGWPQKADSSFEVIVTVLMYLVSAPLPLQPGSFAGGFTSCDSVSASGACAGFAGSKVTVLTSE